MPRDILFLLPATFVDPGLDGSSFHCPACMHVEGLLACYPQLRDVLDIRYVDYERPREALVALLGGAHQGCPVLVVADETGMVFKDTARSAETGRLFVDGPVAITAYLAQTHGIAPAHP